MRYLKSSTTRRVIEACVVLFAWLLAGIAYLLNRHGAAGTLFGSGILIVVVEGLLTGNMFTAKRMGGRAYSEGRQGYYLAGAALFWVLAIVVLLGGIVELVNGS
jgi:hypothetical protein